jgi:uncharacterized iron-regulated membrane protein
MVLWGIERTLDEHLWLGEDGHLGSMLVQIAGVLLVLGGSVLLIRTRRRWIDWIRIRAVAEQSDSTPPFSPVSTPQ